jgi:hypothetical protein
VIKRVTDGETLTPTEVKKIVASGKRSKAKACAQISGVGRQSASEQRRMLEGARDSVKFLQAQLGPGFQQFLALFEATTPHDFAGPLRSAARTIDSLDQLTRGGLHAARHYPHVNVVTTPKQIFVLSGALL